jgi:hypothetical protein
MHNLTPLGMLMHLKDLDRQAVPKLRPLRSQRRDSAGANAVGIAVIALVRRLHALGIAWRVVKHS